MSLKVIPGLQFDWSECRFGEETGQFGVDFCHIQGTFVLEVPGLEDGVFRHCSCFPYDEEFVAYLSSASVTQAQVSRMYNYSDYSCCIAEAGRVHRGELFAIFEYISSALAVVISSAGHGKAELNLVLCLGSPASVKITSEKASVSILLILLRLHIP